MVWVIEAAFVSGHNRFGLIALSLQKEELWASIAGAVVSVGGCLIFASRLTPIAAAWIFVAAEATTLVVATLLLRRSVPRLRGLDGLGRPVTFAAVAGFLTLVWSPNSPLVMATTLAAVYLLAIAAFEREGVRRLIAFRSLEAR
jgi:O-antigen/teichoic acid export membrane protein